MSMSYILSQPNPEILEKGAVECKHPGKTLDYRESITSIFSALQLCIFISKMILEHNHILTRAQSHHRTYNFLYHEKW